MTSYQLGILLALGVAAAWTCSALAFSHASRLVGSVPVNLIRLVLALAMLTALTAVGRGRAIPTDATHFQATWLAISGVVGFFVGDLALFRAYVVIGARRATLLMSLAPAFAAAVGYVALGERVNLTQLLGAVATLGGVMWVIAERESARDAPLTVTATTAEVTSHESRVTMGYEARPPLAAPDSLHVTSTGLLLGLVGAAGQGIGAVLVKYAYRDGAFDPFASTQLRAAAAVPLFVAFVVLTRRSRDTWRATRNGPAMGFITLGAFAGPFLGVSMFNASVARIESGLTSTLAGMVPVFMLPVAAIVQRERVTLRAAIGAAVAVAGVAVLALASP